MVCGLMVFFLSFGEKDSLNLYLACGLYLMYHYSILAGPHQIQKLNKKQ